MIIWRRGRLAMVLCAVLALAPACTTSGGVVTASSPKPMPHSSEPASTTSATPRTSDPPPVSSQPRPTSSTSAPQPVHHEQLHPKPSQLTRDGMWWAVDSVAPIGDASLSNVRQYYRGSPTPVSWGRYVGGSFAVTRSELAYASAHGIGVYFVVADDNCSACPAGDACGNDITAKQAVANARLAVSEAEKLHLPRGIMLYKDIEEVGACHGELTAAYLIAWYRHVRATRYVPAFYGNSNKQDYDFPRAYCAAVQQDPAFRREVTLAQDEPEPQLGADEDDIGPRNAPHFAPYHPQCTSVAKVHIWQYGESISRANSTDVDEVVPGTHGILAPDGHVT